MIRRIQKFFRTETTTYNYALSLAQVVNAISSILHNASTKIYFSDLSIKKINGKSFSICYNSGGIMSAWYSSTIIVDVNENANNDSNTTISTKIKTSWLLYIKFCSFLLIGLVSLISFLPSLNTKGLLYCTVPFLIVIPIFCIWAAEVNDFGIKDRYLELIHKELRKIEVTNK
jgi:hypothetical protein